MKPIKNLSIIIALAIVAVACSSEKKGGGWNQGAPKVAVEAVKAMRGTLPLEERVSGVVRANNQVEIFPQVSGPVAEVLVENGDRVEKGQVLMRLRKDEFIQRINQASSGLDIAKAREAQAFASLKQLEAQLIRTQELSDKNLASELEIETIQAQVMGARANYDLAVAQRKQAYYNMKEQKVLQGQFEVRSPVSGQVGMRMVEEGQVVGPNNRVFVVGDMDHLRIQFTLTEDNMNYVSVGQKVLIRSNSFPNETLEAEVSRISPFLDPVTHTTQGEIDISNEMGMLRSGMFVNVDIRYGESELATLVPNAAIYKNPRTGMEGVFVAKSIGMEIEPVTNVNPNTPPPFTEETPITFVPIEVVARGRHMSGISNIKNGQWVVTIGQNLLMGQNPSARVRAVDWQRVLTLQQLKEADLLDSLISAGEEKLYSEYQNATM